MKSLRRLARNRFGGLFRAGLAAATPAVLGGCLVAAAGAGAGAAIHLSDRGAESVVTASVDRTYEASRQAFRELGITEGKSSTEQDGAIEKRELQGSTTDRDVTVSIKSEGSGAHVAVVARKSAVTWDKDLAKQILQKIVAAVQ